MASAVPKLLILLVAASVAINAAYGCGITIKNNCGFTITTCAEQGGNIALNETAAGSSRFLDTGCNWPGGSVWASPTGQCNDRNMANLAEFTIESPTDFYDLSNVNAYFLGVSITAPNCPSLTCVIKDIRSFCRPPNKLVQEPNGSLVCINDGGSKAFETACPEAYAYATEELGSTSCGNGVNYQLTFCPS